MLAVPSLFFIISAVGKRETIQNFVVRRREYMRGGRTNKQVLDSAGLKHLATASTNQDISGTQSRFPTGRKNRIWTN